MKKLFEKIIEGVLACSGFVTSITIVLIILFLFSEALGLFNSRVIEEGYVLALNKDNKVSELTPAQIKDVFDEEITNWNEVGGQDMPIRLFRLEDITQYYTEEELGAAYEHAGLPNWWNVRQALLLLYRNSLSFVRIPSTYCRITPFR
jgi:phosphate transport system permease protein